MYATHLGIESPTTFKAKDFVERTSEDVERVPLRSMRRTIVVRVVTRSTRKGL